MKSVLPITVGVFGVGALIYFIYIRQRDKDKKKKSECDNNNQQQPAKTTAFETLEFKVDNNLVPLIVGRNSVNLKSIEDKTKTHIKFRECGDEDNQICAISGCAEDVKNAKQLIDAESKKQPIITDEILLPTSSCGKIEGYCGSVLHEICQKSSAKVWIDPGARKVPGENRRVLITGTKEQVDLAKLLIDEKIKETPVEQLLPTDEKKSGEQDTSLNVTPFPSNSSITTTDSPREIMLPSPEKLKNNDGQLEVYVSAVASPSRFWVQLCGPQTSELDFLVDAMTEYYNQKENQELHAIREPYLGQIVAAMFLADNKWYRAEIVAIQPNSNDLVLDVYFLDYGDQQYVGRKEILELRADFLSLRFQAIECFLANIQPINTGSKFEEWDRQAIEKFEELVKVAQWKKMISKVVTYKEKKSFALQRPSNKRESSPIPGVELYEEENERNVALKLVSCGYAEMSDRFGDLAKSSVLNVVGEADTLDPIELVSDDSTSIRGEISFDESNKSEQSLGSIEQPEDKQESPVKTDDHKEGKNDDQSAMTNGKKSKKPESSSNLGFGGAKTPKTKKKKQATDEFLKNEQQQQQNPSKKYETHDWNKMMD